MRIYADVFEMQSETRRDIHEMGTWTHSQTMQDKDVSEDKDYETLELSPCAFTILSGKNKDRWVVDNARNLDWCYEEFQERWKAIDGEVVNPGEAYKMREETWSEFLHKGQFAYTYSERFALAGALQNIVWQLDGNPETRHGILPIFNTSLDIPNIGGVARIPCSMFYQFLRRRGELDCIYVMRSSDFVTHFIYDIWLAMELQLRIAQVLQIPAGRFTFFTGSLHIYRKDYDAKVF